jgi:hypothetical protein
MSWWHEAIIDYMLERPDSTLTEMADHFGRTVGWLYMIRQSDAFQARLRNRRAEHAAYINASQATRLEALLEEVTERLAARISEDGGRIPVGELRGVFDSVLRATGYIQANGHATVNVQGDAQIALVDRGLLEKTRQRLLEAQPRSGTIAPVPVIQGELAP